MGAFLKIALIVLGIYLIGKLIVKSVVSHFLGSATRDVEARLRQQQQDVAHQKKRQEGKVTINYQPKSDKNFGKNDGDYVDFEEV
jgi:hypothetical protein